MKIAEPLVTVALKSTSLFLSLVSLFRPRIFLPPVVSLALVPSVAHSVSLPSCAFSFSLLALSFHVGPLSLHCCHSVSEKVESITDPLQPAPSPTTTCISFFLIEGINEWSAREMVRCHGSRLAPCTDGEQLGDGLLDQPRMANSGLPRRQFAAVNASVLIFPRLLITSMKEESRATISQLSVLSISFADDFMRSAFCELPLLVASVSCNLASVCFYTVVLKCLMFFFFSLPVPPLLLSQMESPVSTPAPPPLHLLATVGNSEIASPCEQIMVRTRSVAVNTSDVALATEPECLGPCEPGTSVNLEGIVWQETEDGKSRPWLNVFIVEAGICRRLTVWKWFVVVKVQVGESMFRVFYVKPNP